MKAVALSALIFSLVSPIWANDTGTTISTAPQTYTVNRSPVGDVGFASDNTARDTSSYQVRIGELHAPGGEAYILPFLVPPLGIDQHVTAAHLRFQLRGIANDHGSLAKADLYGIGVHDSDKPLAGDYYQGAKPDPKATLLQANFLTPASPSQIDGRKDAFIETSLSGDAALAKFLDDVFSRPENAEKYVLLRISYDADTISPGNNAYMLLTTGASGKTEAPVMSYTLSSPAQN